MAPPGSCSRLFFCLQTSDPDYWLPFFVMAMVREIVALSILRRIPASVVSLALRLSSLPGICLPNAAVCAMAYGNTT